MQYSPAEASRLRLRATLLLLSVALLILGPRAARAATLSVSAGQSLQAAIDSAQPGDTILVEAGATFTGPFTLRNKGTTSEEWITIRTSAPDSSLPPAGERLTPDDAALLPKLVSPGSGEPAVRTEPGAHHYRLLGLEIAPASASVFLNDLVTLGSSGTSQDTLAEVPHHLKIERSYVHAFPTQGLKRGILLNSAHTDVLDSTVSGFKVVGQDSQAIAGFNGPGPFKIINNYLEGAGENLLFGGADPAIPNLVPSDIEIRRNHFFKPLSWRVDDPSYAGTHWTVKNLFELKNAQRVVVEGNVFENNWGDAQTGYAILLTVRNQDGGCTWCVVRDVELRQNVVRHSASAVSILGTDNIHPSQPTERITIAGNVFEDINGSTWNGSGWFLLVLDGPRDLVVDHNTVFQSSNIISADGGKAATGFVFTNNINPHNSYGVIGSDRGIGLDTLNAYFPGYVFRRNILAGGNPKLYPPDNFFPATLDDVGFVDRAGGDYRLASGSPYKGQGTDGQDLGADIDAVDLATAGAISGRWTPEGQLPYPGPGPAAAPGTIEAENFDDGGEGVAWHDVDAGNNGGVYRSTDVDVRANTGASNGHVVFNAVAGEWLEHTIQVAADGFYEVGASVASRLEGGTFHVEIDGVNVTGSLKAPTTGSWSTFQTISGPGVALAAGTHVLRLVLDTNGVEGIVADFDSVRIAAPPQSPYPGPAPAAAPGSLEAENFDQGGERIAWHDVDAGNNGGVYRTSDVDVRANTGASNGHVVFNAVAGEWLEYTVDLAASGSYEVGASVASRLAGGTFHVEIDGVDVTGPLQVPTTGSWSTFQPVGVTGVALAAGRHLVRLVLDTNGVEGIVADFDTVRIVSP